LDTPCHQLKFFFREASRRTALATDEVMKTNWKSFFGQRLAIGFACTPGCPGEGYANFAGRETNS